MSREFYDKHKNFSFRTLSEYYISPGIRCKFDLLKNNLNSKRIFPKGIDLGSSGNSFLSFLDNIEYKSYYVGETQIVDGSGKILSRMKREDGEGFILADIDIKKKWKPSETIPDRFWIPEMPSELKQVWDMLNNHGKS